MRPVEVLGRGATERRVGVAEAFALVDVLAPVGWREDGCEAGLDSAGLDSAALDGAALVGRADGVSTWDIVELGLPWTADEHPASTITRIKARARRTTPQSHASPVPRRPAAPVTLRRLRT
ncbi:MAG TPA: hypothetical protein VHS54_02825 [Jatrophihabitans sp.]|nr:hypothetical protein [Jatrophihabitans sp.]